MPGLELCAELEIGIAGCGIAGLVSAILLSRAGHRVVLYDQMEAAAPVGSGLVLQKTGLTVLAVMGLQKAVENYGQRIDRLFGKAGQRPILDVRYGALKAPTYGVAIHRAALFHILYEAAKSAGVEFEFGRHVSGREEWKFVFETGEVSARFDLLVDALGVRSPLSGMTFKPLPYSALWATLDWDDEAGFDAHTLEQRYEQARKMVGVLPVGTLPDDPTAKATFFWSLKHQDFPRWQEEGLAHWKDEVEHIWPQTAPLLSQIKRPEQLTLARYTHHTLWRPYGKNIVAIGDSYHAASPQLGQGANMALLDAWALSYALGQSDNLQDALQSYHKLRRYHVRLYQIFAAAFTPVYQSDSRVLPILRDYLVPGIARIWPFQKLLATLVAGTVGRPLKRLKIE